MRRFSRSQGRERSAAVGNSPKADSARRNGVVHARLIDVPGIGGAVPNVVGFLGADNSANRWSIDCSAPATMSWSMPAARRPADDWTRRAWR